MSSLGYRRKQAARNARIAKAAADVDYPPEVIAQSEAALAQQKAKELRDSVICADCGKTRGHIDHLYTAQTLQPWCRFVEPTQTEGNS